MKNFLIIIILLVMNAILLFNLNKYKVKKTNIAADFSELIEPLKISLFETYNVNGKIIPNLELYNLQNENRKIMSYLGTKMTLILLYSEVGCNICTDTLLANCNELYGKYNGFNILAIAHANDRSYLLRFSRINKLKFPVFNDSKNTFVRLMGIKSLHAILLVNPKGQIVNSFFINPNIKMLNKTFFDYIHIKIKDEIN